MQLKDALTAIGLVTSSVIAVVSWFYARHKDREHEKFRLRLQKRIELVNAALDFKWAMHARPGNSAEEWNRLSKLIQAYGTKKEVELVFKQGEVGKPVQELADALNQLIDTTVLEVRKDLGLESLT